MQALSIVTALGFALLLAPWVEASQASGFRTDADLLVEGAPDPDRSPRDRPFQEDEYRVQVRIQAQYDHVDEATGGWSQDARIRRARWIGSWKPDDRWAARCEVDLDDDEVEVLDLYATYELKRWSRLWMGQFKSMLSRSYLSSSGGLLFTERPLAVRAFVDSPFQLQGSSRRDRLRGHGGGRVPRLRLTNYWYFDEGDRSGDELGIRLRGEVAGGNQTWEASGRPAWTLRLEIHPDGNPSYKEGNLAASHQARLSFDLAYHRDPGQLAVDLDGDRLVSERDRLARRITNVGWVYRRDRFSSQAEFFRQTQTPAYGLTPETRSRGGYVQAAWVWEPFRWEMAVRQSHLNPDVDRARVRIEERAVSLVRYFDENLTKAMLEVVETHDDGVPGGGEDRAIRLQFQHTF